jgi:hypothetical protein
MWLVDQRAGIVGFLKERPQQPPQFAVPGCLTALLEVIPNIHRGGLHLDGARVQMRHLALDVQAFGVRIEDQRATISVRDFRPFDLAIQFSFQESHSSAPDDAGF